MDKDELSSAIQRASAAFDSETLANAADIKEVEQRYLGKGGLISNLGRELYGLDPDAKRLLGSAINDLRSQIKLRLEEASSAVAIAGRLEDETKERLDLSQYLVQFQGPQLGSLHLVTQTRQALEDVFIGMGFSVADGPEVESEWNNFEALNIPRFHPARDSQDSFFLNYGEPGSVLLRTHTSPVQVRLMMQGNLPIYSVMPGRVFRRDTADARHTPGFHQIEGLVIDRGISFKNLAATVATFTGAYFGEGIVSRLRPAYFPFTEPSAEFEITCAICLGSGCKTCSGTGWIELGGCGMVHPKVLRAVGIDPEEWSGFAFGFGIDRLAQMKHSISDMRVFLDNDVRFLSQFRG